MKNPEELTWTVFAPASDSTHRSSEVAIAGQADGSDVRVKLDRSIENQESEIVAQCATVVIGMNDDFLDVDILVRWLRRLTAKNKPLHHISFSPLSCHQKAKANFT